MQNVSLGQKRWEDEPTQNKEGALCAAGLRVAAAVVR